MTSYRDTSTMTNHMELSEPFADLQLLDDDDAVTAPSSCHRDVDISRYKCELCDMRFRKKQQR